MRTKLLLISALVGLGGCGGPDTESAPAEETAAASGAEGEGAVPVAPAPEETHLSNVQRLTHGGSNSEAYFSADGTKLIFQATREGESECDQIYTMNIDGTDVQRVSNGGRTTCGYFFPMGDRILFSSTHHVDAACPPPPDRSRGYVWQLLPYDIFTANPDGSDLQPLTDNPGYDAEATISPNGEQIVFTSHRDGDVNLFIMDADGGNVRQLTDEVGYDGGAFFSPDGNRIIYRAHHPTAPEDIEAYRDLLAEGLVQPTRVELFIINADGTGQRQLTDNGAANFAPFFHPDGRRVIYSSNVDDPQGRRFSLYMIDVDTGEIERITSGATFDSFPMFSPDGSKLVFASDRGAAGPREFNVFVADWVD